MIKVICVGKIKEEYLSLMIKDYYKRIRIEYRVPAKLGDTIIVNKEIIEDKIIIKLCSENNITYAIVEFSYNL